MFIARVIALAFLFFAFGSCATFFKIPPGTSFIKAFKGGISVVTSIYQSGDRYRVNLWRQTKDHLEGKNGVTKYEEDKAYNGYTLYTSGHEQSALLIDMQGKVVHRWAANFNDFSDESYTPGKELGEYFKYFRKAQAFPNGDLLVLYIGCAITPWGLGMARLDKDSNVLWSFEDQIHHDFELDDEGNIYTLGHHIVEEIPEELNNEIVYKQYEAPYLDDTIIKLSPEGKELKRVSVLRAIMDSNFHNMLKYDNFIVVAKQNGDMLHTNSVEPITAALAEKFPFAKEGQVLISMRDLNMLAIIDMETEKMVWYTRGIWQMQHDPDLLDNGNIMVYDNRGDWNTTGSRIIEFNPVTSEIEWFYTGTEDEPFYSHIRGAQQKLPNENVLITDSNTGRLFEVSREKEVVWEYVNPERATNEWKEDIIAIMSWATRLTKDEIQFEFNHGK